MGSNDQETEEDRHWDLNSREVHSNERIFLPNNIGKVRGGCTMQCGIAD